VLNFLYVAVSWVLLRWHDLFNAIGLGQDWAWALSIVALVITARLLLFRLFVKQVHYQRNMQKMQPKIQKLREKHKDDRAELNRQMMKLQQEEGFNPLTGCLPMFLQIPVFLGLYHVLRHLSNSVLLCPPHGHGKSSLLSLYTFSSHETCQAATAKLLGAPLAASFHDSGATIHLLGGSSPGTTRLVLVFLLIISSAATLATQLLVRANATVAPEGTAATIQRVMLWIIPVGVLASGLLFNFPLGVLLYWFTSNLWTLGQQAYIIRFHPQAEDPIKPVGELGKTLAPRPGQRPVRMTKGTAPNGGRPEVDIDTDDEPTASTAAARSVPRPGQRPNRPTGKRPPAKRPTQAKKRR
jgi:YidC/Oxa1 family membrane protein insertase